MRGNRKILTVLLTAQFMSLIGVSIVNVVLPSIQTGLGASAADLQWVLGGYALAFGVMLIPAGRLGDLQGRSGLFILGVSIFVIASIAAGVAADPTMLNLARVAQGIGSGIIGPQVMGMIQTHFQGPNFARAYGWLGTISGLSLAVGPLIGGALVALIGVEHGWRFTFLINVPLGALAILLALAWFPRPLFIRRPSQSPAARHDLDPIGNLLLTLSVLTLMLPFVQGRDAPWLWWLLAASAALLVVWVRWEQRYTARGKSPMVDLRLFSIKSFAFGNTIGGLYFLGNTSLWVLIAIFVQQEHGFTALETGLVGLPAALITAVSSHWAGRRVTKRGRQVVVTALAIGLIGLASTVVVLELHAREHISLWWLLASLGVVGIAQGAVITPNQTLTMRAVPVAHSGTAGGVTQTFQRIGTAVGITFITTVYFSLQGSATSVFAINTAISVIFIITLVALRVSLADRRREQAR